MFVKENPDGKKSYSVYSWVTVWAKYLSASEKSYLDFSENAMDYWIMSYY